MPVLEENLLYSLLWEGPGHAVGFARMVPLSIAVACSCGWNTTWLPHDGLKMVAKRFNQHLPVGHRLYTGQVISHNGEKRRP